MGADSPLRRTSGDPKARKTVAGESLYGFKYYHKKKAMRDYTWSVLLAKEAGIDQLQTQHRRAKGNDEKVQGKNELTVAE